MDGNHFVATKCFIKLQYYHNFYCASKNTNKYGSYNSHSLETGHFHFPGFQGYSVVIAQEHLKRAFCVVPCPRDCVHKVAICQNLLDKFLLQSVYIIEMHIPWVLSRCVNRTLTSTKCMSILVFKISIFKICSRNRRFFQEMLMITLAPTLSCSMITLAYILSLMRQFKLYSILVISILLLKGCPIEICELDQAFLPLLTRLPKYLIKFAPKYLVNFPQKEVLMGYYPTITAVVSLLSFHKKKLNL